MFAYARRSVRSWKRNLPVAVAFILFATLILRQRAWNPRLQPALPPAGDQLARALAGAARRKSLSADSPAAAQRYADILSGARPLVVAVVMLSCATDACAEERGRIRAGLFEPFYRAAAAPADGGAEGGFLYCPAAGSTLEPLRGPSGLLPWNWLRQRVQLRHLFAVGAGGLVGRAAAAASLAAERARHGDVVAVPGGDGYLDIFPRMAAIVGALGANAACSPAELQAIRRQAPAAAADDDDLAALPLDPDFVPDFVLKVDTDSFLRLPQFAAALYDLVHIASAAANASDPAPVGRERAAPAPAPELFWGHFHAHSVEHELLSEGWPPGGTGYTLSRGLVAAIARRVRPPYAPTCSTARVRVALPHDLRDFLPGEDTGMTVLVHTHAHAKVSDARFHDQLARGHPMARPVTPMSIVVHKAYRDTWLALSRYFSDADEEGGLTASTHTLRTRNGALVPWPKPARLNGGCTAPELSPELQYE